MFSLICIFIALLLILVLNHNPLAFLVSCTCDRERLCDDVRRVCKDYNLGYVDAWAYIRDHADVHEWMRIVACEEIASNKAQMDTFFALLNETGVPWHIKEDSTQ